MSLGRLTPTQRTTLRPFVEGKVVHDLGAGDCALAYILLDLGAEQVIAIDKEPMFTVLRPPEPRIRKEMRSFKTYAGTMDVYGVTIEVAFVSWPANRPDEGLVALVSAARLVIYLGKNTDGSACGGVDFWGEILGREVLAYEPDRANTLIVYGPPRMGVCKLFRGEEVAAMSQRRPNAPIMSYEEAETATGRT